MPCDQYSPDRFVHGLIAGNSHGGIKLAVEALPVGGCDRKAHFGGSGFHISSFRALYGRNLGLIRGLLMTTLSERASAEIGTGKVREFLRAASRVPIGAVNRETTPGADIG
jgi:hypothetical protein